MTYMYNVIEYIQNITNMLNTETNEECELRITYEKEFFEKDEDSDWKVSIAYETWIKDSKGKIVLTLSINENMEFEKFLDMCATCSIVLIRMYELKDVVDDPIVFATNTINDYMQSKDIGFFETVLDHEDFMHVKYKVFKALELHETPSDDSSSGGILS